MEIICGRGIHTERRRNEIHATRQAVIDLVTEMPEYIKDNKDVNKKSIGTITLYFNSPSLEPEELKSQQKLPAISAAKPNHPRKEIVSSVQTPRVVQHHDHTAPSSPYVFSHRNTNRGAPPKFFFDTINSTDFFPPSQDRNESGNRNRNGNRNGNGKNTTMLNRNR
jgi:hypothetical protein